MIYIVEIPHQQPPRCWTAADKEDFVATVAETARARNNNTTILELASPKDLMQSYGLDSVEETRSDEPWIADLIDRFGLDTTLFRSNDGDWGSVQISAFSAHREYLAQGLSALLVFTSEDEAQAALQDEAAWSFHGWTSARLSLQEKLLTPA